ncbi:H-NS histone family protein [Paraburkholderia tropica]|uniref:H-NS histone family protein n=1 Tax=Paraburkholderia tropica TaxID=92647 RepID=UPI002AB6031A|nr:H-NS histone family protein [Paraburkholderia tropica]
MANQKIAGYEKEIGALRQQMLAKFVQMMEACNVTFQDLDAFTQPMRGRKVTSAVLGSAAPAKRKRNIVPKFRNPKTGETWSGMGRAPVWIREAKNRDRFLIPAGE